MNTENPERIAILGAGKSGIAAARLARRSGARVWVLDGGDAEKLESQVRTLHELGCGVALGEKAERFPEAVDSVVVSPGIDLRKPIVTQFKDSGAEVIGEIEFAYRKCEAPVIAVTGTNGKTTTTEMITRVLQEAGWKAVSAGNYGTALSEVVASGERWDAVVVEASSFQLEAIKSFRPKVSVWLNFAADHLDRYDSLEDYLEAKLRIFCFQTEEDIAVIHFEDKSRIGRIRPGTVTFSAFRDEADLGFADGWIVRGGERVLDFSATSLRGTHNAENVMATLAAVEAMGIGADTVLKALKSYRPPSHRCELIRQINGNEFINDSKATNLHALESALRGQPETVVLIAGGKDKGLELDSIRPVLTEKVSHAVLFGQTQERMTKAWSETVPCHAAGSLAEAVETARSLAEPNQTILFSPGASSFDMFTSYEERGDAFREIVNHL